MGRTIERYIGFYISDGTAMRQIKINSMGALGLTWPEVEIKAWLDSVAGILMDIPTCAIDISGPFDTTANGSHATLSALAGVQTPRSLDVQLGMLRPWEAGDPQFGITATATSGFLVSSYTYQNNLFSAKLNLFSGSSLPAWGTTAETVS